MPKVKKRRKGNRHFTTWSLLWLLCVYCYRMFMYPPTFIAIIFISASLWFYYSGYYHKTTQAIDHYTSDFYTERGLVLKDVYLDGQLYSNDDDILKAMDVKIDMPMTRIDIEHIKINLEALPWIKYAVVERLYPSTLSVRIIEHKPIALWQHNNEVHLIDEEGHVIADQNIKRFANLIILVGEDAPSYIDELLTIFEYDEDVSHMISSAIRVGNRRWDIRLHNGIEIKLPELSPLYAWRKLIDLHDKNKILKSDIQSIDLRAKDKIFIQQKTFSKQ